MATIPEALLDYEMNGRVMGRAGNRDAWRAPQGCYRRAGDDRSGAISVATDQQFSALATEIGTPALASDERLATVPGRHANHDDLDTLISAWTRTHTDDSVEQRLQRAGVEATAVATLRDVWFDPQLRRRGTFELVPPPVTAPDVGLRPFLRPSWSMSETPSVTSTDAPAVGQHTHELLRDLLNISNSELSQLETAGVLTLTPAPGLLGQTGVTTKRSSCNREGYAK